jgi:SRSO17 transposase
MLAQTAAEWEAAFTTFVAEFAPLFFRGEVRERAGRYLRGLLGSVERKNGWQMAEAIGETRPLGVQRLFYEARWDADAVRDALQQFVLRAFGDPAGVLVLDETGFLKKGRHSVGVQRQYSGTAGKVENCQLGVFLTYATPRGHVVLDRRLYLPHAWTDDPERCRAAGVPETVRFQTLPALGLAMLEHAVGQGVPFAWVTADEGYGKDPKLLAALEAAGRRYVIAVATSTPVWETPPHRAPGTAPATTVAAVVACWGADRWQRLNVGAGAKGPRRYDWAAQRVVASRGGLPGPELWLLARRSLAHPEECAYYLSHAPADTALATLAQVAGTRWTVEQWFAEAKGEVGLDHYEVRTWRAWHRHVTLAMLAQTFLAWQRREVGEKGATVGERRPADPAERRGDAPAPRRCPAPAGGAVGAARGLVALAAPASGPRPARPLSSPRPFPGYLRL